MSSKGTTQAPATAEPLPRGRHKLSREHVLASQRRRIIAAMRDRAATKGYSETTVSDVVSTARVSRNAFYELFDDKEDCFLAVCDEEWHALLEQLYSLVTEPTWIDAVKEGQRIYLSWWEDRPWMAYMYLIMLPATGTRAQDQRYRTYRGFVKMFEGLALRARREQPALPPLRPLAARVLVGGIHELVGEEVRAGRLDRLHELEDQLVAQVVATLADDRTAEAATG